ncbi:MAG TPA: PAS domain-containing sensor histidine kinase, partial [Syntrophobacteraceae bacterium]|nr:PAS domain-containing sensor histidine kinase [Syntrophobacteraceae bacterium]
MTTKPIDTLAIQRRRRKERLWVGTIIALIVLFGSVEGWFLRFDPSFPISGNILLFALINLNAILLLLLAYFVLRNIVKLIFERKRNILGHKLRTRLIIAFIGLTLTPTLPLFLIATQFISSSLDYWFSSRVEQSLEQAVTIGQAYLQEEQDRLRHDCQVVLAELQVVAGSRSIIALQPTDIPGEVRNRHHISALFLMDGRNQILWASSDLAGPFRDLSSLPTNWPTHSVQFNPGTIQIHTLTLSDQRECLVARMTVQDADASGTFGPISLLLIRLLPSRITEKLVAIASGHDNYLQLKLLQHPLKMSHFITFSIVTLLVIFAAIWFGFFLAKSITMPIQEMVEATQRIAQGDLSVRVDVERDDEIGMLVSSFNSMVLDLRETQGKLAGAYQALQESHVELEERRRYMEVVLENVAAGVVSLNAEGRVMTMNKSAEAMLGVQPHEIMGKNYQHRIEKTHQDVIDAFVQSYHATHQAHLEQRIQVNLHDRPMLLLIKATILEDEQRNFMGVVVVFDDLTEFEKAQRVAAWREVARRIAHEVKNPLTPIKLSAQRLRRKYSDLLDQPGSMLDACTSTIVEQVDHMQRLVNEFSNFARLPRSNPTLCDLGTIVESSITLYRHNYPQISFSIEKDEGFPLLHLDQEQFRQVMINLLENAVQA